eukprot:scaffold32639_cov49-Phaeocystis_antarctica.AAC.2
MAEAGRGWPRLEAALRFDLALAGRARGRSGRSLRAAVFHRVRGPWQRSTPSSSRSRGPIAPRISWLGLG